MRWLAREGGRRDSVEGLYSDLVFAAERLGYCSVKLTLADGEKVWEQATGGQSTRTAVEVLHGGDFGTLELKAPACGIGSDPAPWTQECGKSFCPRVSDERVFEIVSELVAEGWVNAVSKFKNGDRTPLRFDAQSSVPKPPKPRSSASSFAPPPVPELGRKPASIP